MTSPARLIAIGLDAMEPTLVFRWAEDGTLPNLRWLMSRGLVGDTCGMESFVASTWPAVYAGVNPARHGFYYHVQLASGTYDFHQHRETRMAACDPVWVHLSRAGRRVAVFDVPLTKVEPSLNGLQTAEWGAHDGVFGFRASSSALKREIMSRFGAHPLNGACDADRRSNSEYAAFIDRLVQGARTKAQLTRHYLQQGGWDFFMQVFSEPHCAGHQCWHLHDPMHPAHDPAYVRAHGDPLRRIYTAIDAALGEILADAGDALVMVFAAHGMSYWYGPPFSLDAILVRLGVATPRPVPPAPRGVRAAAVSGARRVWKTLPQGVRTQLTPIRNRLRRDEDAGSILHTVGVDPTKSRCFTVPHALSVGALRLNVIGREPCGLLRGDDVESFCAELTASLLEIIDERTGRPLIKRVRRAAADYEGDRLDDLPDLLVEWDDEVATGSTAVGSGANAIVQVHSPKIGSFSGVNDYCRTGEHRHHAWFVAAGPGVQPGRLARVTSIMDFAPTFAKVLGVELPVTDGRAIPELTS